MTETNDSSLVGTLLEGRYRVLRILGEGGMGAVYEVEHERIGRRFALKTLHPRLAQDPETVARFHREARAAGTIGSSHIIEVSDMGQLPNGAPYIVMELLEGQDLGAVIDGEGALPIARVVHIGRQACEGLTAAHGKGIIHRDLKPENIFLTTRDGEPDFVKLLDFGISKFRETAEGLDGTGMTRTGMTLGTPYYMAPEQASAAKEIDARADVYAMGVVLFQALSGRLPYEAPSLTALLLKIAQEPPPSMVELRPDIPPGLESVVHRAMQKEPQQRFDNMEQLAAALEPFADAPSAPGPRASVDPLGDTQTPQAWESGGHAAKTHGRAASRTWQYGLAAVAALGIVAGGIAWAAGAGPGNSKETPDAEATDIAAAGPGEREQTVAEERASPSRSDDVPDPEPAVRDEAETPATADTEPPRQEQPDEASESGASQDAAREEARRRRARQERRAKQARRNAAARAKAAQRADSAGDEPETSDGEGDGAGESEQAQRTVSIRNERRASVQVKLECGGETRSVEVSAGGSQGVQLPSETCLVSCTGKGGPHCPLRLAAAQSALRVR
ncbi:MAG: serine/threonine-protein kinase [Gemmatimonadota bacterium]